MHGSPGEGGDWFAAGNVPDTMDVLLEHHLVEPMIVVGMDVNGTGPSAEDTECLDSTTGGSQVETYISDTVIPWVDAPTARAPTGSTGRSAASRRAASARSTRACATRRSTA